MNTTNKTVSTKVKAKAEDGSAVPAQSTNLTINWEGMSSEDIRALAQQGLIVKLQGGWRRNGIPKECTVKAIEHKAGVRAAKVILTLDEQVANLGAEEKKALLARLLADG